MGGLGIVWRVVATKAVKKARETLGTARSGALPLIPRRGSAQELNIDFSMPGERQLWRGGSDRKWPQRDVQQGAGCQDSLQSASAYGASNSG